MNKRSFLPGIPHNLRFSMIPLLVTTMVLALALTACGSNPEEIFTSSDDESFYAPDALGPFAVDRSSFTIVDADRDGRELPIDAWYPVDLEHAIGSPSLSERVIPGGAATLRSQSPQLCRDA